MQVDLEIKSPSAAERALARDVLDRLTQICRQGEAARADPVLRNMQVDLETMSSGAAGKTRACDVLDQLALICWQGEAARADPVLQNMQSRMLAELARLSPEAAIRARALTGGLLGTTATEAWASADMRTGRSGIIW